MRISIWRVLLGATGALALCFYASSHPRDPQLFEIRKNPSAYVGTRVQLYVEARIQEITPEGFLLRQGDETIHVKGTFPDLVPGNQVGVAGIYQPDGSLLASSMNAADPTPREFRKWISVAGLLIVAVALTRNLRWKGSGLEMKTHA